MYMYIYKWLKIKGLSHMKLYWFLYNCLWQCFVHLLTDAGWNQQNRKMAITQADKAYMPI